VEKAWRPTILIVDDDAKNRDLFTAMLGAAYRVVQADRGGAALVTIAKEPIDLVLLDVMMPGETGFDVCRRIKAMPEGVEIPVILVTALDRQEDRNEGLEAGADDFLNKPVNRRELLLRVRSFLRIRSRHELLRNQMIDLERTQTMKDDLVSLLVHDMRSPLSAAIAYLQLIQEEMGPSAPLAPDVEQALQSNLRLVEILEEALRVRLLEDGALQIHRAPVDLKQVLGETLVAFGAMARLRQVSLEGRYEGEPISSLDRKLVQRSVENLLSNAIKYTPAAGRVTVDVRNSGDQVDIEICDTGPGIPDQYKKSLFEKFGSVEAATGATRKGFGLGLYLVKLVAAAHGGTATVADGPGGGALFRMSLGTNG
jgi:signal transduction histidine kinase